MIQVVALNLGSLSLLVARLLGFPRRWILILQTASILDLLEHDLSHSSEAVDARRAEVLRRLLPVDRCLVAAEVQTNNSVLVCLVQHCLCNFELVRRHFAEESGLGVGLQCEEWDEDFGAQYCTCICSELSKLSTRQARLLYTLTQ